ncbi:16S rRNA (guanine(966)-N(2))-methyltransferase RsmD [Thalassotalea sp. 1_MG-2023]|uniref:16S rRNA (guanine(966)-N(2))-methyltransferase RsmD n=1 Tax=Thalassotalea sp. 1_MG-2023 TaxID=3062680 RepID=UPI0026E3AB07|nr:16S rRNA (guanine(966)-N(2))-methyltransferase RsmD [Thalassotalea sp. 1_MG-2023]MDO6428875.1 16S rRNA (guanine(966)-N(2))-methyltransferase RsmD [Thalassotalea sp. 1_MG-2023]
MRPTKQKTTPKKKSQGNIRIIAGKHRGRKLPVINAEGLRPTTDRVKETVFNWLMPYINDSKCLDCFSGAGSLGFEAISRGATQVNMLELNKQAAMQLKKNKALLAADNCHIHHVDSLSFLADPATEMFNIVFIDPPFRQQLLPNVIHLLQQGWLATDALIYIEQELDNKDEFIPNNWQLLKEKVAGQVKYQLFQQEA